MALSRPLSALLRRIICEANNDIMKNVGFFLNAIFILMFLLFMTNNNIFSVNLSSNIFCEENNNIKKIFKKKSTRTSLI